jgi:hypothetical protein
MARSLVARELVRLTGGQPVWREGVITDNGNWILDLHNLAITDPVAMDTIGWEVVEKLRAELKLKTLTEAGREPAYIKAAADLGLGVNDRSKITLTEVAI